MKTGAKILVESLQREGTEIIFGYPGGVVLPIYDELYNSSLRHILVRHEQAAAHAADGYARASGRVGVCLATSGPGACNLVTGIATAYMDSVPIVALTGQVPTNLLGNDAFQESDITGITMPITKHNYLVKSAGDLRRVIQEAFYIAGTGRQGPVLVDIPKDVSTGLSDDVKLPEKVTLRGYNPTYKGHKRQTEKALELLESCRTPAHLCRRGHHLIKCLTRTDGICHARIHSGDDNPDGDRVHPLPPPAQPRHAGDARDRICEFCGHGMRPHDRHRGTVR